MCKIGLILISFIISQSTWAVYTVGESGDVLKAGTYDIGAEPQIMLSGASGLNLNVLGDYPLSNELSLRGHIGSGSTTFDGAASLKWIPVPDYQNQPAAGVKVELETFSSTPSGTTTSATTNAIRLMPLVSKGRETDYGKVVPYASLPISLMNTSGTGTTGLQLVGGAEMHPYNMNPWTFAAEIGINLNSSYSYISGVVTYTFDQPENARRKGN